MEIVRCDKGHFYDAEQCSSCPTCAREMAGGGAPSFGATEPIGGTGFGNFAATEPMGGGFGATEPIGSTVPATPSFDAPTAPPTAPAGASMPNFGPQGGFSPVPPTMPETMGAPELKPKVESYGSTMPVPMGVKSGSSATSAPAPGFNPVVGWLVCVDGPDKGTDYRIRNQYNYIGRASSMDICIRSDNYISAERAAIIGYDDQEKVFSFAPGTGHNVVRVNGKMIITAVQLNAYDELSIGTTKLLFVPFCGERFDWNA